MPHATAGPVDRFRSFVARAVADDGPDSARFRRAMAGESAARFADRIVLERAAHLVRTTARSLQDIADDSGFRGYDVFARAFRREYGDLPSHWRADPTSHVIDAPGEVHVHPSGALRLPARGRMDAADLVVTMVERHIRTLGELLDAAAARTDGEAAPAADGAGVLSALTRAVEQLEELSALVHDSADPGPEDAPAPDGTVPALRARLDRVGPEVVDAVALLATTGRFDEAFVDPFSAAPATRSFGAMLTGMLTDADGLVSLARAELSGRGASWQVPA
ncbi:helix-turn-helix domain-containing protein [Nocardioides flavus (ex Wang et al. 2016)]|uniref:helix-turn-helix domain-containing protein n=1 Tax=Nocardioides flavus (ex Wang et al. 2016) TaxID=2058780 RepID=UPI001749C483|nr:helix-turn-helix domain-containing protein [Nocardioides flavus (ex Wang et al. 2016)]